MQTVLYIIVALLVFGILILSHEFGHFIMARIFKVQINEFSIGMGPAILKKQGKSTLYSLRAFPIGGYVQMDGEDGDGTSENSFNNKPYWNRFLILVMGAFINILLGFVLIVIINSQRELLPTTTIAVFDDNSVSSSFLVENDKILQIGNQKINSYLDLSFALTTAGTNPVSVTVERDGNVLTIKDVVFPIVDDEEMGKTFVVDFSVFGVRLSFVDTIKYSFDWTVSITKSIYGFLGTLFTGKADVNQISGPVGTTVAIGESLKYGLDSLLLIVALISINLGIVNLLPFPALDGGRVVLLIVESIRRKPLSQKVETTINFVGMMLLFALMIFVAIKDVIKLF